MPESVLHKLYRDRVRSVQEIIEPWQAAHQEAMTAHDVQELVRECLTFPGLMEHMARSDFDLIFSGGLEDVDAAGRELRARIDDCRATVERVSRLGDSFVEQTGHRIEGREQLREALQRLDRLREDFFRHWAWFGEQEHAAARTEIERGDGLTADEAFAEIAGVDVDTWRKRVEERRRTPPP
jgi:hypothetical protein